MSLVNADLMTIPFWILETLNLRTLLSAQYVLELEQNSLTSITV